MIDLSMPFDMPTSRARDQLSRIVMRVQDRHCVCFLTRHGRRVAVVVSMEDFWRIDRQEIMQRVASGEIKPDRLWHEEDGLTVSAQRSAEIVQQVQYDRLRERKTLAAVGLEPVEGGELAVEVASKTRPKPISVIEYGRKWLIKLAAN